MPAYALPSPFARPPLQRRLSGFALAVAINVGLLLILMTLGVIPATSQKTMRGIVIDLIPASRSASPRRSEKAKTQQPHVKSNRPVPKPPITLPVKPTIAQPSKRSTRPSPWIEMSKDEMAAADVSKISAEGSGGGGDSEVVGKGPNGESLYNAEWAREPTDAELAGYLPRNSPEGYGLIECKTIPNDRVEDCIELDQEPHGSHLASAVRQAAWQFRVRPPRKGGHVLIGSWVRIRIDYYHYGSTSGDR